jgi:CBS domain-containing protein
MRLRIASPTRRKLMPSAREIMTPDVTCIGENESLADAAQKMAQLDVGSLPICGEDNRLKGMLTDRDIVIRCLAEGGDPRTAMNCSPEVGLRNSVPTPGEHFYACI